MYVPRFSKIIRNGPDVQLRPFGAHHIVDIPIVVLVHILPYSVLSLGLIIRLLPYNSFSCCGSVRSPAASIWSTAVYDLSRQNVAGTLHYLISTPLTYLFNLYILCRRFYFQIHQSNSSEGCINLSFKKPRIYLFLGRNHWLERLDIFVTCPRYVAEYMNHFPLILCTKWWIYRALSNIHEVLGRKVIIPHNSQTVRKYSLRIYNSIIFPFSDPYSAAEWQSTNI